MISADEATADTGNVVNKPPHRDDDTAGSADAAERRIRLDRATLACLATLVLLIAGVMLAGTGWAAGVFWQTPSLLLVVGGSALATLITLPRVRRGSIVKVVRAALVDRTPDVHQTIREIVSMAETARRDGMLALDASSARIEDGFLRRALQMAIDGMDGATIASVMRSEMEATDLRHIHGKSMLETMGRFAPVFGMIGTVIGLVVMMGHMTDPSKMGPGMAVALMTTLYGLVIANVFCLPLARKLASRSSDELLLKTLMLTGVLAIQSGDHPRIVEQKMRAFLPESNREPPPSAMRELSPPERPGVATAQDQPTDAARQREAA